MDIHTARVVKRTLYGENIVKIDFMSNIRDFTAGQYITVYFKDTKTSEGKAYSLASAPYQKYQSIVVKNVGEYSSRLCNLRVGETFSHSMPYGFFNPEVGNPIVCFAAGVGISPIWSVITQSLYDQPARDTALVYSSTKLGETPFMDEISVLQRSKSQFMSHVHITREKTQYKTNRIKVSDYVSLYDDPYYLVCGSVDFTRNMWNQLESAGVSANKISTEVFFE